MQWARAEVLSTAGWSAASSAGRGHGGEHHRGDELGRVPGLAQTRSLAQRVLLAVRRQRVQQRPALAAQDGLEGACDRRLGICGSGGHALQATCRARARPSRADVEDELSAGVAVLEQLVGAADLRQRQDLRDLQRIAAAAHTLREPVAQTREIGRASCRERV